MRLKPSHVKRESQLKGDYASKASKLQIVETSEVVH
jgi:hypothetical protein